MLFGVNVYAEHESGVRFGKSPLKTAVLGLYTVYFKSFIYLSLRFFKVFDQWWTEFLVLRFLRLRLLLRRLNTRTPAIRCSEEPDGRKLCFSISKILESSSIRLFLQIDRWMALSLKCGYLGRLSRPILQDKIWLPLESLRSLGPSRSQIVFCLVRRMKMV